jgi:selenoprotein W-related protein
MVGAGWMAQELLTTFAEELGSVTLTPDRSGGVFEVRIDDELIWSRKERGRFSGNQGGTCHFKEVRGAPA